MTAAATKLKIAEIADAFEAGAELSATDRAIIVAAARRAPSSLRDMGSRNDDVHGCSTMQNRALKKEAQGDKSYFNKLARALMAATPELSAKQAQAKIRQR